MRIRAGIILLSGDSIALIERVKPTRTYYVVPGGGLKDGEYTEETARREALEELGLRVRLERLIAVVERVEQRFTHLQLYYLATATGGDFGSGSGEEYFRSASHGLYQPVWMPLNESKKHRIYPRTLVDYLAARGLPRNVLHLRETTNFPH